MARHALDPYRCTRTSIVRLGRVPRDDKGKVGHTNKLPSHRYKTPISTTGKGGLEKTLSLELLLHPTRRAILDSSLTWTSEGPHRVTPPIPKEACVQDRQPRDDPRDNPTNARTQITEETPTKIKVIVPYIPQLAQAPMHQRLDVTRQTSQQEAPQPRSTQGEHPDSGAPLHPPIEATIENPNASVSQPTNRSRDVMRTPPEPNVVSSDSTNSVREQLHQVNQRLDEVQRDFVRSKEEVGETTKGGSPFTPKILDKPIPSSFCLATLEPYDGSTDPSEHVTTFRAQMALYDTSN
ncbi:hypothetical protein BHM03_00036814, partial [Ensete ventricosum]